MGNRYYTPEIEDLHIGYVCEVFEAEEWRDCEIDTGHYLETFIEGVKLGEIRTPYLTKEDIESEGWGLMASTEDPFFVDPTTLTSYYMKGKYLLSYMQMSQELSVSRISGPEVGLVTRDFYFQGYCPSVNELRTILKLLKIK